LLLFSIPGDLLIAPDEGESASKRKRRKKAAPAVIAPAVDLEGRAVIGVTLALCAGADLASCLQMTSFTEPDCGGVFAHVVLCEQVLTLDAVRILPSWLVRAAHVLAWPAIFLSNAKLVHSCNSF
jgi:hypothetical protein